jgi:allantoin racemase
MGVLEFEKNPQITSHKLMKASSEDIQTDGAEVIILGCTLQTGWHDTLQQTLGVPVIDVAIAALKYAEFLAHLKTIGWTHSKIVGYESPPQNELRKWQLQEQYNFKSTIKTKLQKSDRGS